jgi:hypothetical protein
MYHAWDMKNTHRILVGKYEGFWVSKLPIETTFKD